MKLNCVVIEPQQAQAAMAAAWAATQAEVPEAEGSAPLPPAEAFMTPAQAAFQAALTQTQQPATLPVEVIAKLNALFDDWRALRENFGAFVERLRDSLDDPDLDGELRAKLGYHILMAAGAAVRAGI